MLEKLIQQMMMFEAEGGGNSGGGGSEEEEQEPEFNEAQKAWMEKQIAKVKSEQAESSEQLAARLKSELAAEQEKTRKANERKVAQEKAKAENDTAEILRLANEEKEAAQRERDEAKAEALKTKETNAKLALVTKHKLPAGYEARILGSTPEEWEKDAAELAKSLPVASRPDMEGGNRQTSTKEAQQKAAQTAATSFVSSF